MELYTPNIQTDTASGVARQANSGVTVLSALSATLCVTLCYIVYVVLINKSLVFVR